MRVSATNDFKNNRNEIIVINRKENAGSIGFKEKVKDNKDTEKVTLPIAQSDSSVTTEYNEDGTVKSVTETTHIDFYA